MPCSMISHQFEYLLVWAVLAVAITCTKSFSSNAAFLKLGTTQSKRPSNAKAFPSTLFAPLSLFPDDDSRKSSDSDEWADFNPFLQKAGDRQRPPILGGLDGRISVRQVKMKGIMGQLLGVGGDQERTQQILSENKDFLVEQLENENAVLDPDTIYRSGMTREQRYDMYRDTMTDRIKSAKNENVKRILTAVLDYVLQFR